MVRGAPTLTSHPPPPTQNSGGDKSFRTSQQLCEDFPCVDWDDGVRPNCVRECQSPACYAQVYGEDALEPGEIDTTRANAFSACWRRERKLAVGSTAASKTTRA